MCHSHHLGLARRCASLDPFEQDHRSCPPDKPRTALGSLTAYVGQAVAREPRIVSWLAGLPIPAVGGLALWSALRME